MSIVPLSLEFQAACKYIAAPNLRDDFYKQTLEETVDVYYLAHPVAGDAQHTYDENIAHIPHMIRLLHECGIHAQAPYYATLFAYAVNPTKEQIENGLQEDCKIVACMRRIVLVGHKLSSGMSRELDALPSNGKVINLIGLSDDQIRALLLQ